MNNLLSKEMQPYDAIINLGSDCQTTYQMHINGIRYYALPFDKIVTSFKSLKILIETNFAKFLNVENLKIINNANSKCILDMQSGVLLFHDFIYEKGYIENYEFVKAIYDRRINRFLTLMSESKNPLFIRQHMTKDQTKILSALLSETLKHKNFKLVVLDQTEEVKENWNLKTVNNMYLRQTEPYLWKGDCVEWRNVFLTLGLKLTHNNSCFASLDLV